MVDVPAPATRAPMRFNMAARSATSGSRAAFSMTVVPSASTAAISSVSVAVWLGNSSTMRAPTRRSARASTKPWSTSSLAPSSSRPRRWKSIERTPNLSPPGIDTRARPRRPTSGPSTTMEARICSTSS
jgi:hypothetical protein